jgi:hypothetical protein
MSEYFPWAHPMQNVELDAPIVVEYAPDIQSVQFPAFPITPVDQDPAGHFMHCSRRYGSIGGK